MLAHLLHKRSVICAAAMFLIIGCGSLSSMTGGNVAGQGPVSSPVAPQSAPGMPTATQAKDRPRLILQITIDALRGDLPWRYHKRFPEVKFADGKLVQGGFCYLMDKGVWYIDAHHPHAHTETVVGHTTLATGAYPSSHGIIGNSTFDLASRKTVDTIKDPKETTVGNKEPIVGDDQSVPKVGPPAASPRGIATSTFSDELHKLTDGQAKIFSVSFKDRAAVPLAGKKGKAFWFEMPSGDSQTLFGFVSSTYYYRESYPDWIRPWNKAKTTELMQTYQGKSWDIPQARDTYLFGHQDYLHYEVDLFEYGWTFPHPYGHPDDTSTLVTPTGTVSVPAPIPFFSRVIQASPVGDEVTLAFAKELIVQEGLGQDDVSDYLAISFSATDLIGHSFGPSSLESEITLLQLDLTLAKLFSFIDGEAHIGLANTLIVLAGDHGTPDIPEYVEQIRGLRVNTGRLGVDKHTTAKKRILDTAAAALPDPGFLAGFSVPYIYLDTKKIKGAKADPVEIQRLVAEAVMQIEGIAVAIPASYLGSDEKQNAEILAWLLRNKARTSLSVSWINNELINRIRRNQHAEHSGDIYVLQEPEWQFDAQPSSGEPASVINHGTPWPYDTLVPIVFAGANVRAEMVSRPVRTVDVAATLSAYLCTNPPSGLVGEPLQEVIGQAVRCP